MFQDLTSIVVDLGSQRTSIGYGGDDAPKLMPYSYLSRFGSAMSEEKGSDYRIGDKYLWSERADNELLSIYQQKGEEGYEVNYELLEAFLAYNLVHELGADLKDYSVLLSEDVAMKAAESKEFREKTSEFLFEKLGVANVFYLKSPVLSCFSTGRSSALVVDSGHNFTRSVAVHEGYCLLKSARVAAYGGSQLSQRVEDCLNEKTALQFQNKYMLSGTQFTPSFLNFHQQILLSDIKEALSVRRQEETGSDVLVPSVEYELPDRRTITIARGDIDDRFISGDSEAGFRGAAVMAGESVSVCDVDVKKELYSNVLMIGGNILYGSYVEDIISKVGEMSPPNIKVKGVSVCAASERKYLSWIGGSIVTSLSSFQSYWVGSQEWKECGAAILDRKCT
jgi:actin-related protein